MSSREKSCRPFKIEKDLKTHLMQSLEKSNVLKRVSPDEFNSDLQYQTNVGLGKGDDDASSKLKATYLPTLSPDVTGLQFQMANSCQEIQQDSDSCTSLNSVLSHRQLVESLDRLSSPPPSQLSWVRGNAETMAHEEEGQMQYDQTQTDDSYSNDIQEDWNNRCQLGSEDEQQAAHFLTEIEHSLHERIDDELATLRANLHGLVADQQHHLRRYLTPPQYSQDIDAVDVEIISNQDDFTDPQTANLNLEDTGWASDCMQSSCSTINEPMKLEEASPDSAVDTSVQESIACQQQQESTTIINRLTEESEIQNILIQLQTTAAILSHTLRRPEYSIS